MTAWLTGMLAIASGIMCVGLWPLIRIEAGSDRRWWRNRALRISGALYLHGVGAVVMFASPVFSTQDKTAGIGLYCMWAGFGLWLLSKTLIVSAVSHRLRLCFVLFAVWSAACALWGLLG